MKPSERPIGDTFKIQGVTYEVTKKTYNEAKGFGYVVLQDIADSSQRLTLGFKLSK